MCYLARMQGDTWGSTGGVRWKWEVSLTSTADSCSWISKNSCERWQVLIIFYSLSQSPGTHCNYGVSHSVKFCHNRSLAACKEKLKNIDSRALVSHKGKNVFPAWLFSSVCLFIHVSFLHLSAVGAATVDRCRKYMFVFVHEKNSFLRGSIWTKLREKGRKSMVEEDSPQHLGSTGQPVLCSGCVSPWQRMRKQVVLFKTPTRGSTLIWGDAINSLNPSQNDFKWTNTRHGSPVARRHRASFKLREGWFTKGLLMWLKWKKSLFVMMRKTGQFACLRKPLSCHWRTTGKECWSAVQVPMIKIMYDID